MADMRRLSYENDFRHLRDPLIDRMDHGTSVLDGVLELTQMRIDAERVYAESLKKIITRFHEIESQIPESESLGMHGLTALCVDCKNEYAQRVALLKSVREDVRKTLIEIRNEYQPQKEKFAEEMRMNKIKVKAQQREFSQIKAKYDRVMNSKKKYTTPTDQLWYLRKQFKRQQKKWSRYYAEYQHKMTSTLRTMQNMELQRMKGLQVALTNWSAFIVSYCQNRSYDITQLTRYISQIDPEEDLQTFMQSVLDSQQTQFRSQYRTLNVLPTPNRGRSGVSIFSAEGTCCRLNTSKCCTLDASTCTYSTMLPVVC